MSLRLLALLRPYSFLILLGALAVMMRQAAGRLAPRVAIAPLVFLITRTPVLIGWLVGAGAFAALLLPKAIAHGHDGPSDLLVLSGICALCGLGVATLTVGPGFFALRAFAAAPVVSLEPGERLLHDRMANHFLGGEARGGRLLVTSRRLAFRPHRFNAQLATWSVRLEEIADLRAEGDRFLVVALSGGAAEQWLVAWGARGVGEAVRAVAARPEQERAWPGGQPCAGSVK